MLFDPASKHFPIVIIFVMDFCDVATFFDKKIILVTGATGFLAKILVEKILRVQPNVKRLYLLVRARDNQSAATRLRDEVTSKDLFRNLKSKWGVKFDSFISEKVTPVVGDASYENLGIDDHHLMDMQKELHIIVNTAATTKFNERYDVALGINTIGARNVIKFAKCCPKIHMLLHVSTAYVSGEKVGFIPENPYDMGEALNGLSGLDIDVEKDLVDETLKNLRSKETFEKSITGIMKDLGTQRARKYGWPNTYVFTKAMGEMLIKKHKDNLPVVIIRPTIIVSTYKEPFPGWVEGVRTLDSVAVAYGKGKLNIFFASGSCVLDLVPADMVVNAMIVAMIAHANQPSMIVYQIGSSLRNPITFNELHNFHYSYFNKNPWTNLDGKSTRVKKAIIINNKAISVMMTFLCSIFIMVLELVDTVSFQYFHDFVKTLQKKLAIVVKLVDLYRPYLFSEAIFDDINTENLQKTAKENGIDEELFFFDPTCINWEEYFMNIHIAAIVKYCF